MRISNAATKLEESKHCLGKPLKRRICRSFWVNEGKCFTNKESRSNACTDLCPLKSGGIVRRFELQLWRQICNERLMWKPPRYRNGSAPENAEEVLCREGRSVSPDTLEQREAATEHSWKAYFVLCSPSSEQAGWMKLNWEIVIRQCKAVLSTLLCHAEFFQHAPACFIRKAPLLLLQRKGRT